MLLPADSDQHCGEVCFVASSLHNPSTSCSWLPLLMKTILKQECSFCILPTQWAETEGKAGKVRYVPSFVEKVCWLCGSFQSERCFAADAGGRVRLARIPKRRPGSPFVHSSMLTLRKGLGISGSFYILIDSPTCCQLAGKECVRGPRLICIFFFFLDVLFKDRELYRCRTPWLTILVDALDVCM